MCLQALLEMIKNVSVLKSLSLLPYLKEKL